MSDIDPLDVLRNQILNFEHDKRKVDPDEICKIYAKVLRDRSQQDYQTIQKFLWDCNLFVTIRNSKVISDASVIDLIK